MSPAERTLVVLQIAARLRHVTTLNVGILADGWSYDTIASTLRACVGANPPLLMRMQPPAGRGRGSARAVYTLAAAGAGRLLASSTKYDATDLHRQVRASAKQRLNLEAGRPTHVAHGVAVATLDALLIAQLGRIDAELEILGHYRDPKLAVRVGDPPAEQVRTYRPDSLLVYRWNRGLPGPRRYVDVIATEVETGAGSKDARVIARTKGKLMRGLRGSLRRVPLLSDVPFNSSSMLTSVVWTSTQPLAKRFERGLLDLYPTWPEARVTCALWLPLTISDDLSKPQFSQARDELIELVSKEVFFVPSKGAARLLPEWTLPRARRAHATPEPTGSEEAPRAQDDAETRTEDPIEPDVEHGTTMPSQVVDLRNLLDGLSGTS